MIVCFIAEGSYPYVSGGVSTWIHQLITGMPHINFKILSLMPTGDENLEYKYKLPSNLIEVKTIYLDDYKKYKHKKIVKKIRLKKAQNENFYKFLEFDSSVNFKEIIDIFNKKKRIKNVIHFLQSKLFWKFVIDFYHKKYKDESFNNFYWTLRTMYLHFIQLLYVEVPEADIYHSVSTGYAGVLGAYLKEKTKKPFVLTEHGIYAREREEEILKAKWVNKIYKNLWIDFFYFMSKIAYQRADKIITLFERNREIQIELGAPKEITEIIPNGVDINRFDVSKERHDGFNIGAVLRVVPIKDVMTMIRAYKIIKDNVDKTKLYLIGPTEEDLDYYQQCIDLVKSLKLEEDVIFTGKVNVLDYLKKIDVLLLTSISEGQPLAVLEGMAAEIPIVSSDVGSCRELLSKNKQEDRCGIITGLVSPNDTAAQTMKLLNNKELRDSMGKNGKIRIERTYNIKKLINNYRNIYNELG